VSLAENAASLSLVAELTGSLVTPSSHVLVSVSASCCLATVFFELRHGRRGFSSFRTTPLGVLDSDIGVCELLFTRRFFTCIINDIIDDTMLLLGP